MSPNSNNGTNYGATFSKGPDGNMGTAMSFDGTNDYVDYGNNSSLNFTTGPFTCLFWAKATYKNVSGIIGKKNNAFYDTNPGWFFQYAISPQKLYVGISNGISSIEYNTGLDNFEWMQMGIMRDTNNLIYFIKNGVFTKIGTLAGDISNNLNLEMGRGIRNSVYSYSVSDVDDVRIYNTSLSTSQIKQEYVAGLNSLLANGSILKEEYSEKIAELAKK